MKRLVVSRKVTVVLLLITCYLSLNAQDMKRARSMVDTLASPFFSGRGYVNSGDSLAAEFLAKEFQNIGLQPFSDSYFQKFEMSVNTFPGEMWVKIGRKKLVPGKEFIVDPSSSSVEGRFRLNKIDSASFKIDSPQEIRVVLKNKLTFSVSDKEQTPNIFVLKSALPKKHKTIEIIIENKFIQKHHARNVIGFVEGTTKKDSFLLITAHYDHLGPMGRATYFPGANDNASGVAMMLELARFYSLPENRLPFSLMFVGFAAEEAGLIGSKFYVNNPLFPLSNIKFMLNLDLMGSGKEGVTVVNGSVFKNQFALLDSLNKANNWLPLVKPRGKAANSDHYFFSEKGVPAFFMYTNGEITAYHDVDDTPEVVTFSKFKEVFALITAFFRRI